MTIFHLIDVITEKVDEAISSFEDSPDDNKAINVFQIVDNIKKTRMKMIDTFEQYKYVHRCLAEYFQSRSDFETLATNLIPASTSVVTQDAHTTHQRMGRNDGTVSIENDDLFPESEYVPVRYEE